jgi:hypothetical protein
MGDDEYGEEEEGGYSRAQEEEYDFIFRNFIALIKIEK